MVTFFSFVITHLLNFGLSLRRLLKITGKIIRPLIPVLTVLSLIGGILAGTMVTHPLGRACAFTGVYFSLLVLLRVLGWEDLHWLRGLAGRGN